MSRLTLYALRLSPLAALLLGFFLRVYRLADKNIWWDEGWSLWLAKQDFVAIALRTAADEHPPLHYWMLKVWIAVFGSSAYAGRYLSVIFGMLTIALVYRLGKSFGISWVGILAAFILATSRFHIWWSQDIKNYTPSIFFAFAAVWFALALTRDEEPETGNAPRSKPQLARLLILYAVCSALALFTHYLAALVLLALNIYTLTILRHASRRAILYRWLVPNLLAAILFAPWLALYLQYAQPWAAAPAFDFGLFLKLVATVLPLGVTTDIDNYLWLTGAFGILALLGCAWAFVSRGSQARKPPRPYGLFALIVLIPAVLIYALSLTPAAIFAPKIQARYLVILAPAHALLVALGIAYLSRRSRVIAACAFLFVLASSAFVLRDYYTERRLTDEYATLANTINSFVRQGDLVLLDTDQEWPTFLYYLRAPVDWLGVPNGAVMTGANADSIVQNALARNRAIWLVTIPDALATDPQKLVETRLARDLKKQFARTFDEKSLALYASDFRDFVNVAPENFAPQTRLNETGLLGFDLPVREAYSGDTVRVVTYWKAARDTQFDIGLGAISASEHVGLGDRVRVESDLLLPPNATGELSLKANQVEIARVRVKPRANLASAGSISHPTDQRFGDIHLVGYDLSQTQFRAGDLLPITLYWKTELALHQNYVVFVHLLGTEFNAGQNNFLWGQVDRSPSLPVTAWQPNQIVADQYRLPIALNAPRGKYQLEVGLYDAITGARLRLGNGTDSVNLAEVAIAR